MSTKAGILLGLIVFYTIMTISMGYYGSWICGGQINSTTYQSKASTCVGLVSATRLQSSQAAINSFVDTVWNLSDNVNNFEVAGVHFGYLVGWIFYVFAALVSIVSYIILFIITIFLGGITTISILPWWLNLILFAPLSLLIVFIFIPG